MQKKSFRFGTVSVDYYFEAGISRLKEITDPKNTILLTDENVFSQHPKRFKNWNTIVLKPGEDYKVQATVDSIVEQLIEMEADRKTTLVGVGGGVITDLTGYVASIYMRGIRFGFVPTTILSLVDASIGGKNGIDVGVYKNMVGIIRQPSFILHDLSFLASLPENEWRNGFAEIIKHACIRDAAMFRELESRSLSFYQKKKKETSILIRRNALLKTKVVQQDEFEQGDRKLLNFGHTLGHALENQYELSHGEAISIGMTYAATLSGQLNGFRQPHRVVELLEKYGLPTFAQFDKDKVINVLKMDKKKNRDGINFILLEKIGKAFIQSIRIDELYQRL
ncbi:MAG: 3-dehydroquinate synthase [Flavisolibacter sp.]